MDLSRAFQTTDPATLISKLRSYGLDGTEHDWFNEYLPRRKQIIYPNGELSPEYQVATGVPQGSLPRPHISNSLDSRYLVVSKAARHFSR